MSTPRAAARHCSLGLLARPLDRIDAIDRSFFSLLAARHCSLDRSTATRSIDRSFFSLLVLGT